MLRISGTMMPQWIPFQGPILAPKYLNASSGSTVGMLIFSSLIRGSFMNQVSFLATTSNIWLFSTDMFIPRSFRYLWSISIWRCAFLSSSPSRTIDIFLSQLTMMPLVCSSIIPSSGSRHKLNSGDDRGSPCLTPLRISISTPTLLLAFIFVLPSLYIYSRLN